MRWLFPKTNVSRFNTAELNRKLMINYLEFVLPRWIWCGMFILLYINLRCLDLPELEGIEIPTDIIIANLCLFFFAYITLLGWGMLKIISLAPEVVERVFNAIIGKYDKD